MRTRLCKAFIEFHDIRSLSHAAAARKIADDGIDLLVDLKGYTANSRPQIAAQRPAPVQISWLGYPGTVGHPRLADYIIGDPVVTPPEHARYYSETLALMPHCYQPNDRQRVIGQTPTRLAAGIPEDAFVFCCFNQSYKITLAMFDLWCRLLGRVSRSVLWLLEPSPPAQERLRREATSRGVDAERILFAPRLPLEAHLGRLRLANLALDTYPYTSHTTASDALWVGVPMVTLIGQAFVSRVAASIVTAAGLPELVVQNAESYLYLAMTLATRPERLNPLREKLARQKLICPLFDSVRFTRHLERVIELVWANYRAGTRNIIRVQPDPR